MELKFSEKRKTILLVSIILLALAIVIALYTQIFRGNAKAIWWDQTWLYRKGINISNSNTVDLTNYQISFVLDTAALIAEGEMQVDCDDLRLVDSNNTLLSHWIEEDSNGCNSSYTKIWVKVPTISQGVDATTLYAYYGNPGATNVEDGESVFRFFDDFNDTVIDSTKWPTQSLGGYISESGGELIVGQVLAGDYYIQSPAYSSTELPMIIEARTRTLTTPTNGWSPVMWWQSTTEGASILDHGGGDQYTRNDGSWSQRKSGNPLSEYHKNSLILSSTTGWTGKSTFESTTSASWSVTHSNTFSGDYFIKIGPRHDNEALGSQNTDGRVDYIFAREYASVEPTISFIPEGTTSITPPIGYWKLDDDFTESSYTIPTDGLFTHWTLDQETGTGAYLLDESGNGNHATPTGTTFVDGLSNGARSFDGINDYVRVDGTLASITPITITGWVNPLSTSGYVVNQFRDVGISWGVKIVSGEIHVFNDTSGVSNIHYFSTPITPGEWIHFAAGHKEDGFFLYLNGQLIGEGGSDGGGPTSVSGNFFMGQRGNNSTYLNGIIDEVLIYNRALDSTEVSNLYGKYKPLLADSSGNDYHGVPIGTTVVEDLCISGKCRSFDGINDYISIGTLGDLGSSLTTNSTTFQFWIKTTDTDAIAQFGTVNDSTKTLYAVNFNRDENDAYSAGKLGLNIRGEAGENLRGVADVPDLYDGEWHFVSVIGNVLAKSIEIYIDGAKQTTVYGAQDTISTTANFQHPFVLGASNVRGTIQNYLDCDLDQIKIYDYARTEEEMKSDYIAGASIVGSRAVFGSNDGTPNNTSIVPPELTNNLQGHWKMDDDEVTSIVPDNPNLVGYWDFQESSGSGSYLLDKSINNNNASPSGTAFTSGIITGARDFTGDYISAGTSSTLAPTTELTVSAWVYARAGPNHEGRTAVSKYTWGSPEYGWNFGASWQTSRFALYLIGSDGSSRVSDYSFFTDNLYEWVHMVGVFKSSEYLRLYKNGEQVAEVTTGVPSNIQYVSNSLIIGRRSGQTQSYWDGKIDEVGIFNKALTSSEVESLYQSGATIQDSSEKNNNGFGVNTTSIVGKFGNSKTFNSSNSMMTIKSIDLSSTDYTIETWFKYPLPATTSWNTLTRGTSGDHQVIVNRSTNELGSYESGGTGFNGSGFYMNTLTEGWHHLAAVGSGSTTSFYIDGEHVGTSNYKSNKYITFIGNSNTGGQQFGPLDEFRVYNTALSADQVYRTYSSDSSIWGIATGSGYCVPGDTSTCNKPLAEWLFNGKQGTIVSDTSGNSNHGTLTGATWTKGKSSSGVKFDGVDDYIDLSSTLSNIEGLNTGTISGWFKSSNSSGQQILNISDKDTVDDYVYIGLNNITTSYSDESFSFEVNRGGVAQLSGYVRRGNGYFTDGEWHHFAITSDSTGNKVYIDGRKQSVTYTIGSSATQELTDINTADTFRLGNRFVSGIDDSYFNGSMDQIRVFDYALNPAQIAWDYNGGEPIAYWKLDECQGTTAYDSSVNSHNGTINIGASGTQVSPGFCTSDNPMDAWYNGSIGKFNSSLSFDGVDDHIQIANSDDLDGGSDAVLSVAAWFKATEISGEKTIISKYKDSSNKDWGMSLAATCNSWGTCFGSPPYFRYFSEVGGMFNDYGLFYGPIETDKWYHGVFVLDQPNNNLYLYLDGKLVASDENIPSVSAKTTIPVQIGRDYSYGWPFSGQIDEVRIYNYALTPEQIQLLYNNNSVVRF